MSGDFMSVSEFTCPLTPEPLDSVSISAYVDGVGAGLLANFKAVLYSSDGINPVALLASGSVFAVAAGAAAAWKTSTITYAGLTAGSRYWIGIVRSNVAGTHNIATGDPVAEVSLMKRSAAAGNYATVPTTFPGVATGDGLLCVYLTYTTVDVTPPTGSFTAPAADYATVSGAAASLAVSAADVDNLITSVVFKDPSGGTIATDTTAPYSTTWNTTGFNDGTHTITAVITDAAGLVTTISRIVKVVNRTDVASPLVKIWTPSAGSVAGTVPVRVGFYDDLSVSKVDLLVDGAVVQTTMSDLDSKVVNGGFEVDTSGWVTVTGGTLSRTTAEKKYGAAGASLVAGAVGHGLRNDSGLSCTVGVVYSVGVWVKGTAAQTARISIRDSSNNLVGSNQDLTFAAGVFQYVEFEFTPTATGVHKLQVAALSGAQTFFVDGGWITKAVIFSLQTAFLSNAVHTISARVTDGAANATTTATINLTVANVFQKGPSIKVEIGFATKPRDDVQTWTDVSTYLRRQISWWHGRADAEGRVDAGECELTLDNRDRRFDPTYAAGPYYANLKARRLRVTANYAGSAVVVHEGTIQGWPPDRRAGGTRSYVTIRSVDDFEPLNRKVISSSFAALTTALTGANNDLVFTTKYGGGEDIEIEYVSSIVDRPSLAADCVPRLRWSPPRIGLDGQFGAFGGRARHWWSPTHAAGPPPSLGVDGRKITVNVVVSDKAITTTAAQVKTLIEATPAANELVTVANAAGNDGTGVVTAMAATKLVGGVRALERSGARIAWVLDQLGHPTSRRAIDTGAFDVQAVTLIQAPGLQHAKEVAATELGVFFCDGTGKAVFHDSLNRAARMVKATYATNPLPNLVSNPDFEANTTGWSTLNSATLTRQTTDSRQGLSAAAGRIVCGGVQYGLAQISSGALKAGVPYRFTIWVRRTETTDAWHIDCTGGSLAADTTIPATLGWQKVVCSGVTSGTSATNLRIINQSVGAASTIFIDDARFEQADAAGLGGAFHMLAAAEEFDWDKVRNEVTVSAPGLDDALASDATSQTEYWPRSHQSATLLTTQAALATRAALLLTNYKDPKNRIETIRIAPARQANETQSTSVWVMALSLEVSDKLTVEVTPAGGGALVSYAVFVERVEHRVSIGDNGVSDWGVTVAVSN